MTRAGLRSTGGTSWQSAHTGHIAVRRPAFQAIIEALHHQMQQHLAAEKAAAAAASAVAAKGVSPFGTISTLMKVRVARAQTGAKACKELQKQHISVFGGFNLRPCTNLCRSVSLRVCHEP